MAEPLSPDHVFYFLEDEPFHDLKEFEEELEKEPKEEPKEDSKEDPKKGPKEVTGASPITPPLLSESSLNSEFIAPVIADRTVWMPHSSIMFEVGRPSSASSLPSHLLVREDKRLREDTKCIYGSTRVLEKGMRTHQTEIAATHSRVNRIERRMDTYDVDLGFIKKDATMTSDQVLALQEENYRLRRHVDSLEVSNTLAAMQQDRIER
nr:hypothetical protein [Tanacetum cinerariifolium]